MVWYGDDDTGSLVDWEFEIFGQLFLPEPPSPLCGMGQLDAGEECDDGNRNNGDGCSNACQVEFGSTCVGEPSLCAPDAVQDAKQQACINVNNKSVATLAKSQGKAAGACIKNAARGRVAALGVPPQEQTAQACLDNDVGAKAQRSIGRLLASDARRCRSASSQLPDFGYDDADASIAGGRLGVNDLIEELFGSDLDAALVLAANDKIGAKCQHTAQREAQKFFDTLWKSALTGQKNALRNDATRNTIRFQVAILAFLATDTKLSSGAAKLERTLGRACNGVSNLTSLFPGACSTANLGTFSDCVTEAARCRFCGSLNRADRLAVDCDDFDNGIRDGSC